jgi:two-component system NtrC family sensor kinase
VTIPGTGGADIMVPKGIHQKITLGFYVLLLCIMAMAGLTYGIVHEVGNKMESLEIIDDFLNMTLEVRRFEKNYFLYGKEEDYLDNTAFLDKLGKHLLKNATLLTSLMGKATFDDLWRSVRDYQENITRLHGMIATGGITPTVTKDRQQIETSIRTIGKKLTDIAELSSKNKRKKIKKLLGTTGNILIVSVLLFIFLCVFFATLLGRDIVKSFKILEDHTKRIARGDFMLSPVGVKDEEIKSLLQAFNRMTRELRMHQKQLVQSEKLASLGTLLSGVAHELNNPLSNVSSSAQILGEDLDELEKDFKRDLINQILEQSDRARDIVRTLLEFSRISDFAWQELSLKTLVEKTITLLRGQIPSDVAINLDIPEDLNITVDKQRMQQVFLNLIKNALDVIGPNGQIWISCREIIKKEKDRREVEILIEDNGPGIPAEIRDKIFDPFFTTKDVGHGSGLGLFIVHDIIEMHGGSIRVESRPGQGTTFILWLPDRQAEAGEKA